MCCQSVGDSVVVIRRAELQQETKCAVQPVEVPSARSSAQIAAPTASAAHYTVVSTVKQPVNVKALSAETKRERAEIAKATAETMAYWGNGSLGSTAARKLQGEIDSTLQRAREGIQEFSEIWFVFARHLAVNLIQGETAASSESNTQGRAPGRSQPRNQKAESIARSNQNLGSLERNQEQAAVVGCNKGHRTGLLGCCWLCVDALQEMERFKVLEESSAHATRQSQTVVTSAQSVVMSTGWLTKAGIDLIARPAILKKIKQCKKKLREIERLKATKVCRFVCHSLIDFRLELSTNTARKDRF